MKKKLLALIPLLFLAGCGSSSSAGGMSRKNVVTPQAETQYSVSYTYKTHLPTVHTRVGSGSHITYLMMSPYGQIDINGEKVKGGDYEPKFYENCIIWESEPGGALPAASTVSSELYGVTFRGWYQYNDKVYPDKLETVPAVNGSQVFAIFDGPTGGGGSSGSGGGQQGGGQQGGGVVTTGYGFKWESGKTVQAKYLGPNMDGKDEYVAQSVSFEAGDVFSLYDFSNGATWAVSPNPWSFGDTDGTSTFWQQYITLGTGAYTARQSFTADVYIQLQMNNDTIYFELK